MAVADYLTTLYKRMAEISEIAEKKDLEAKEKTKKWFDGNTRERRFEVGESVLVLMPERKSKLEALYSGPYTVMEQVSPVTYKLDLRGQHGLGRVVHINLMKKWNTPTAQVLSVTLLTDEEEPDQGEIIMIEPGGDEAPVLDDSLNAEQRQEVSALLQEFATVFSHLPGKTRADVSRNQDCRSDANKDASLQNSGGLPKASQGRAQGYGRDRNHRASKELVVIPNGYGQEKGWRGAAVRRLPQAK